MKRRMLALLLTLCMVVSLLPAQMVAAEGETANVTILGNGSQFVLKKDGAVVNPLSYQATVSVPVGSTLGAEGYSVEEWDRDTQYLYGWSANSVDIGTAHDALLHYEIDGDVTFEAGWEGKGGGEEPDPQYNMGFVLEEDALFIVYPVEGEPWSTNGVADRVEAGKTLRDRYADISMPTHQSDFNKRFDGWMICTQDPNTGMYEQIPGTQIIGLSEALDYPASDAYTIFFVAQWRTEVPAPMDLGTITLDTPFDVDISFFPGQANTAVAAFTPAETGYYMVTKTSNGWQNI